MAVAKGRAIQRDWVSKSLAGALLGLTLALGCSAVFARLAVGIAPPVRAQLTMWTVTPVWLSVFGSVYFFDTGKRAWLWLGAANLLVLASVAATRVW